MTPLTAAIVGTATIVVLYLPILWSEVISVIIKERGLR